MTLEFIRIFVLMFQLGSVICELYACLYIGVFTCMLVACLCCCVLYICCVMELCAHGNGLWDVVGALIDIRLD